MHDAWARTQKTASATPGAEDRQQIQLIVYFRLHPNIGVHDKKTVVKESNVYMAICWIQLSTICIHVCILELVRSSVSLEELHQLVIINEVLIRNFLINVK